MALVNALKDKCEASHCDGIGLFGLAYSVDFYLHAGFSPKGGTGSMIFFMNVST
jgi:hypothetical protein